MNPHGRNDQRILSPQRLPFRHIPRTLNKSAQYTIAPGPRLSTFFWYNGPYFYHFYGFKFITTIRFGTKNGIPMWTKLMYKIHQLFKFRPKHSKKIWQQKTVAITYFGGADGTQTHDLYDANVALYQLSYNPKTLVRIRGLEPPRHCCH